MSNALKTPGATAEQNDEIQEILDSFQELPTIPEVLVRIWEVMEDPATSARDLERIVSLEPPLAAKALRLANSPYFGWHGKVRDVRAAITLLGFDVIRNLAVCLSVAKEIVDVPSHDAALDRRALWRHSIATAILARELSQSLKIGNPEQMFTAGVLHDVGMYVLSLGRVEAYSEVLRRHEERSAPLEELEREVFGFDHADFGGAFAARWNFPETIQGLIGDHHNRDFANRPTSHCLLSLADELAYELRGPVSPVIGERAEPSPELFTRLGVSPEWVETRREDLLRQVEGAEEFMNLV